MFRPSSTMCDAIALTVTLIDTLRGMLAGYD